MLYRVESLPMNLNYP